MYLLSIACDKSVANAVARAGFVDLLFKRNMDGFGDISPRNGFVL
jgi:hypothetical protein